MEDIKKAQEAFGELIKGEYERIERMKQGEKPVDFDKLDKIVVGILPGDGIDRSLWNRQSVCIKRTCRQRNRIRKNRAS